MELKDQVKKVLHQYPTSRNSDKILILHVMKKYGAINNSLDFNPNKFMSMPCIESITRHRRFIQNKEKLYLPVEAVRNAREDKEQILREHYGRV